MKKFYTIILTAALACTFCGCNNPTESTGGGSGMEDTANVTGGDKTFEDFIKTVPDVDFPMPDGTVRRREDIDRLTQGVITFDVAYVRTPKPLFETTLDNPEIFNKENFEFCRELEEIENVEWIPVKAGDVLESGLVVENAYTMPEYNYPFENNTIEFNGLKTELTFAGELELEGILIIYPGNENYGYADSSVTFIPDCTKFALPIPTCGVGERPEEKSRVDAVSKNALIYDGAEFNFGNLEDAGYDFGSDAPTFAKVRMKIKNVVSRFDGYDGEIVDCTVLQK